MEHRMVHQTVPQYATRKNYNILLKRMAKNWELYLFIAPVLIYFAIFHYYPMYGVQIAFKDFIASQGITGSPWVGFKHFYRFFTSHQFGTIIRNTVGISLYQLVAGFPAPILLALMLNEVRNKSFKKTVQMATYAPHFISTVVLVGMITAFLSPKTGIINKLLSFVGLQPISFMTSPEWFKTIYVFSGIWQNAGWGSIIYMAALAGIDQELHEAAIIDGASKLKRIWYINIPGILPTAIILLILNVGNMMSVGFEKVFMMQNEMVLETSEVISTFVYDRGLLKGQFSFSSAVGLFNSIINFTLLVTVNKIAKRISSSSLW